MHGEEARVNAQLDLARMRREMEAKREDERQTANAIAEQTRRGYSERD